MLEKYSLLGSRKSHSVAIHGIAQHRASMGKISARSDQLLNDALGVSRRPLMLRCTGISRCLRRASCLCLRMRRCGVGMFLPRISSLCMCTRRGGIGRRLRPAAHYGILCCRHTLLQPLSGLAREWPGPREPLTSGWRWRCRRIRWRRRDVRAVRGACTAAGSVRATRRWFGLYVSAKISARWPRSIDTHHMLILSDLVDAGQITRKINAVWQPGKKEFHFACP